MMRVVPALFVILTMAALAALSHSWAEGEPEYAGSKACANCHKDIDADYARSGHPLKIQKVDGAPPVYPPGTSPGVPAPPSGMEWSEISHVIGGYGWKARFMDREGYVLTGESDRQFNLPNETLGLPAGWSGYDATTSPRKPYTCGACHTTGWVETGPEGPHQDGLPGIHGTWKEAGVTCEACHGPGAAHAASPAQNPMSKAPNCANCHVRGDVTRIDASGGLIRHHEQYEDLLASPHRDLGCLACHDPHKSSKFALGGFKGQQPTCLACHGQQSNAVLAAEAHDSCTSCHMPFAGKSAVATTIAFKGGTLPKGDIRSHVFRISTDPAWSMFTDDGEFVRVDDKGRAFLTVEYTCLGCHIDRDKAWALESAGRIHEAR